MYGAVRCGAVLLEAKPYVAVRFGSTAPHRIAPHRAKKPHREKPCKFQSAINNNNAASNLFVVSRADAPRIPDGKREKKKKTHLVVTFSVFFFPVSNQNNQTSRPVSDPLLSSSPHYNHLTIDACFSGGHTAYSVLTIISLALKFQCASFDSHVRGGG